MFWRLLLTFVGFAVLAALGGAIVLRLLEGRVEPFITILLVFSVGLFAFLPAWMFARHFVRPLHELTEGAGRIAGGDYGHRIHGGVWGESRSLAETFNRMSDGLAAQFEQLEADREQLRAILGGMVEGVVALGPGQRVLFANEAAGRMLEFDPQSAIGRAIWEVSRQRPIQELLTRALHGAEARREEFEWAGPTARHLAVYAAPLPGAPPAGAVLVIHDITDLRRLEGVRQEFVANVSHELKTPLAVITACIETLLDGAVDEPDTRQPFLQQIADQGQRLHALILDLISLARIESGEEVLDFEAVVVENAVAECLQRHQPRADAKHLRLLAAAPNGTSIAAWADEEALGQILDNLVDNAVKYTQEGGAVQVRWREIGKSVEIEVEDNGPGIPEADLTRIFERFYRVDKARSRQLGGTGLGLAIVKHLSQVMKGSVKAASAVGNGTTFTVSLPNASPPDLKGLFD
jgi:two-component system phosphate regulon sensor histidine kinase PhoR